MEVSKNARSFGAESAIKKNNITHMISIFNRPN